MICWVEEINDDNEQIWDMKVPYPGRECPVTEVRRTDSDLKSLLF